MFVAEGSTQDLPSNDTIRKITPAGDVSTFAGTAGQAGSADGTGAAAQFDNPQSVAVDASGNLFVADSNNSTIRKITPAGDVSTFAGTAGQAGNLDGTGAAARFNFPNGVAVGPSGNIYVADSANATIRKITAAGAVSTFAGSLSVRGSADGTSATFSSPSGVAIDDAGTIYVSYLDRDRDEHTKPITRLRLARSSDGGRTFAAGTAASQGVSDKPELGISHDGHDIAGTCAHGRANGPLACRPSHWRHDK